MKKIDPHTLFSAFEQGDEAVYREHGMEEQLQNPFVLMGMVLKGLEQYELMDILYTRNYGEKYKEIRSKVKLKYYLRLFGYLERIDSTSFEDIYQISLEYPIEETYTKLNDFLNYFESLEYYENCAVVKRYIDQLTDAYQKIPQDFSI